MLEWSWSPIIHKLELTRTSSYAQKTEIALVKVWATNSDDWMDILKVTTHIIVVGMWIILFTLLATFRLTAFDSYGFYFLESGYASNYPKVN